MRTELLYNPRVLCERLAVASARGRRLAQLRGTPAANLSLGHIDTLELVQIAASAGIDVVYDVGANAGTFSLLAKSLVPLARIHAFEPLPEHQLRFRQACERDPDVTLHPIALGSENTEGVLRITDFSDASSLLPANAANRTEGVLREVGQAAIPIRRMDDYRLDNGLPLPDLIKLDVQGYELEALRGAPECLKSAKAIISEVSFIEYYEGQCLFHDVVGFLAERKFFLRALGVNTSTGALVEQTDVLFLRGQ